MKLLNSQKITSMSDMAPYSTAVMEFIEGWNLPSFSYPEVYEYFVAQKGLGLDEDLYFDFVSDERVCTADDITDLVDAINELDLKRELFWQRKNKGISEANRAVRKAEHDLAVAEAHLADLINESAGVIV